jgi:hypothetical protein
MFGAFPTVETLGALGAAAAIVIGSYVAAERRGKSVSTRGVAPVLMGARESCFRGDSEGQDRSGRTLTVSSA